MADAVVLDIASIAAGGDGVARHEGLVVFVPRVAPGERVRADITPKGRMARGVLREVLTPSATRVEPTCVHYVKDACGGCQLQHVSLDAQREAKRHIVQDALTRIGKRTVPLPEIRGGASAWRYRRKLTLAMRRRAGGEWYAGLHAHDDPDRVFALEDCHIADARLIAVWREVLAAGRHLPSAQRLRGAARLMGEHVAFVLEGGTHWGAHEHFFAALPSVSALWWVPEQGTRRLLADRRTAAEPGASFAQVNPEVAAQLEDFVVAAVAAHAPATVVDAYAGAGGVARRIAEQGARVTAIELDREATAWSAAHLPAGSTAIAARVEDALGAALPADLVILNPPRTGVDARVTALLADATRARAIIYVSCDPATLARDVARLPGWRVARVTAFDMFPQTAHVETVCELVPLEAVA
jgi:23S rRNA (uracil1939-C5)-methyltransferase